MPVTPQDNAKAVVAANTIKEVNYLHETDVLTKEIIGKTYDQTKEQGSYFHCKPKDAAPSPLRSYLISLDANPKKLYYREIYYKFHIPLISFIYPTPPTLLTKNQIQLNESIAKHRVEELKIVMNIVSSYKLGFKIRSLDKTKAAGQPGKDIVIYRCNNLHHELKGFLNALEAIDKALKEYRNNYSQELKFQILSGRDAKKRQDSALKNGGYHFTYITCRCDTTKSQTQYIDAELKEKIEQLSGEIKDAKPSTPQVPPKKLSGQALVPAEAPPLDIKPSIPKLTLPGIDLLKNEPIPKFDFSIPDFEIHNASNIPSSSPAVSSSQPSENDDILIPVTREPSPDPLSQPGRSPHSLFTTIGNPPNITKTMDVHEDPQRRVTFSLDRSR